jgi:general secretion pathway protein E
MTQENELIAKKFKIPVADDLSFYPFVKEGIKKIPYLLAKKKLLLPLDESDKEILLAITNPLDSSSLEELRLLLNKEIKPIFCRLKPLKEAIEKCYQITEKETEDLFAQSLPAIEEKELALEEYDLLEQSQENPVIRLVNTIILEAIQQKASDIHFEPQEKELLIRYRIDGVLLKRRSPPSEYQNNILTRIKVMAKLDIAEKRLPQDGRIKLKLGTREIDFRVSSIPVIYGERIVMRILDRENIFVDLHHLGMNKNLLEEFVKMIDLPEGIILVTGPTGSGKTTTLYSAIAKILSSETNIMTIEDPVEYKIPSIAQIAVNPKIDLTFAKGLRHILRQDPDVIMIGEIRDKETAEIAIQSALTGHLVFSTLHTNDAPSAVTRLADMGIEPYLIASSLVGVLAQRLIRKLCPHCKKSYSPSLEEKKQLKIDLDKKVIFYKPEGCSLCLQTGYQGRIGIFEMMKINHPVRREILKNVDSDSIREAAYSQKMQTLFQQGVECIEQGLTSTEEILRITKSLQE